MPIRRWFVVAVVFASIAISACSTTSQPATATPSSEQGAIPSSGQGATPSSGAATAVPDEADVAAARQQIESADLSKPETVDALEGIRFTAAGEDAARVVLASSPSNDVLWAATWVYMSSSTDPAPLQPLLQNPDASIRTMAAAAVVAMGDRSGFAILASSLSDPDQLRGSHPPRTIGSFATHTLFRYVEAAGIPAEPEVVEELPAAQTLWATWLEEHEAAIQFDASRGSWMLP